MSRFQQFHKHKIWCCFDFIVTIDETQDSPRVLCAPFSKLQLASLSLTTFVGCLTN